MYDETCTYRSFVDYEERGLNLKWNFQHVRVNEKLYSMKIETKASVTEESPIRKSFTSWSGDSNRITEH